MWNQTHYADGFLYPKWNCFSRQQVNLHRSINLLYGADRSLFQIQFRERLTLSRLS